MVVINKLKQSSYVLRYNHYHGDQALAYSCSTTSSGKHHHQQGIVKSLEEVKLCWCILVISLWKEKNDFSFRAITVAGSPSFIFITNTTFTLKH
mmetsp:Transcript_7103/g.20621  ORF Transcript_7103/g.20621 Transcript_7103/m.20621 type:complete len:94 (-) Transcript_7103:80-361(-)